MEEEKRIYIGNLEYSVTEEDLQQLFQAHNLTPTEVKIIKDRFSGKPKGFGFAGFQSAEEAQQAISALDGQEVKGRKVRVSHAKKQQPRQGNRSFRKRP